MISIYTDRSGKHHCIVDGIIKGKVEHKMRMNSFNKESEYAKFLVAYDFDRAILKDKKILVFLFNAPAVNCSRFLKRNDRVIVFGTIHVDKYGSNLSGVRQYYMEGSVCLCLNDLYKAILMMHSKDKDMNAVIMREYTKRVKKAKELNMAGDIEFTPSEQDVLL